MILGKTLHAYFNKKWRLRFIYLIISTILMTLCITSPAPQHVCTKYSVLFTVMNEFTLTDEMDNWKRGWVKIRLKSITTCF